MIGLRAGVACVLAALLGVGQALGADGDNYEIGPEDVLHVRVLGQEAMTSDFSVNRDGMIVFPALGKVMASGFTVPDFERKLTTLLADGYLKRPEVGVSIKEYKSHKVRVTGEVQKPGTYVLKADQTLLALFSELGGASNNAGHEVIVIRPPQAATAEAAEPVALAEIPTDTEDPVAAAAVSLPGSETIHVSLLQLQAGKPEANIPLRTGDMIYFPKARQVFMSGQVGKPGPYRYQEGMTVLQALTMAGGVTARGAQGRLKIVRTVDGVRKELKPKPGDPVLPDDTLIVPEKFF